MRLLEVEPNFIMSQAGTVMTILQHLKSKMGDGVKVPFNAISNLMRNVGYSLTFADFMDLYNSNENIQKLVQGTPSENEITVGANPVDVQGQGEVDGDAKVNQMAQRAAKDINQS